MRTPAVDDLAERVWTARERRNLKRDPMSLGRAVALVVAQDVRDFPGYDPECDVRVAWLRGMVGALRRVKFHEVPRVSEDAECGLMMALGKLESQECGKAAAARNGE